MSLKVMASSSLEAAWMTLRQVNSGGWAPLRETGSWAHLSPPGRPCGDQVPASSHPTQSHQHPCLCFSWPTTPLLKLAFRVILSSALHFQPSLSPKPNNPFPSARQGQSPPHHS